MVCPEGVILLVVVRVDSPEMLGTSLAIGSGEDSSCGGSSKCKGPGVGA